jgi:hypothetical protein
MNDDRRDAPDVRTASGDAPRDPQELEAGTAPASAEISPLTTVGAVHLTVSELRTLAARDYIA